MGSCKLSRFQLLTRRTYKKYAGAPVAGTGGYPYCLADTVPANHYWILWYASVLVGNPAPAATTNTLTLPPQLNIIPAGIILPTVPAGTAQDDPFFQDYFAFPGRAYGPGLAGLRIDDGFIGPTLACTPARPGDEMPMIKDRSYHLIEQGATLMGWQQQYGTPANPGTVLELRICYSQLLYSEDFDSL